MIEHASWKVSYSYNLRKLMISPQCWRSAEGSRRKSAMNKQSNDFVGREAVKSSGVWRRVGFMWGYKTGESVMLMQYLSGRGERRSHYTRRICISWNCWFHLEVITVPSDSKDTRDPTVLQLTVLIDRIICNEFTTRTSG